METGSTAMAARADVGNADVRPRVSSGRSGVMPAAMLYAAWPRACQTRRG